MGSSLVTVTACAGIVWWMTAIRHSMAVVFANYGGPTGGLPAGGKSAIWSESGGLLAELGGTGEGAVIARESYAGWQAKTVLVDGVAV